ncbi:reverse transcriptase domain-containing protein [Rhodococcus ruber]|uniref:reverse transcriptase domain-containing protein n=1 Tax=Rhodococcus ruber TaxID=1830 RepID=UPI0009E51351|nr:reverse transcriptase domain-containing protein [Rhodococcus ruber]QSE72218.1 hypothetical protein JYA91_28225 [Rhodococcus sp. PSBB049]
MISPLLCNVYLHRIDRAWNAREHGVLVRFADDVVVMCRSREQAEAALARLRAVLAELGLEPKEAKTRIVHLEVGGGRVRFPRLSPPACSGDRTSQRQEVGHISRSLARGQGHEARA